MRMRMQMPANHLKAKANVSIYCCYFCSVPPSFPPLPPSSATSSLKITWIGTSRLTASDEAANRLPWILAIISCSFHNTRHPSPFQRHSTTLVQRLCRWEVTKLKSWPNPRDSRALQLQSNSWRTQGLFNCLFCVCVCVTVTASVIGRDTKRKRQRKREIEQEQKQRTCNLIVFLYNAFGLASLHCLLFVYPIERLFDYLPNELALRFEEYL